MLCVLGRAKGLDDPIRFVGSRLCLVPHKMLRKLNAADYALIYTNVVSEQKKNMGLRPTYVWCWERIPGLLYSYCGSMVWWGVYSFGSYSLPGGIAVGATLSKVPSSHTRQLCDLLGAILYANRK